MHLKDSAARLALYPRSPEEGGGATGSQAPAGQAPQGQAPSGQTPGQQAQTAPGGKPAAPGPTGRGLTDHAKPEDASVAETGKDGKTDPASVAGPYKPEGLDAKYLGKSDKETIDNLAKANKSFRDSLAKRGAPPETPEGYKFELGDELKDKITLEGEGNKAALDAFSAIFHEEGLSQGQAQNIFRKVMAMSVAQGWTADAAPVDTEAWLSQQYQELGGERQAKRRNAELQAYAQSLAGKGLFTPEMLDDFGLMIGTSTGVRVMEAILAANGMRAIPTPADVPGAKSQAELQAMTNAAMAEKDPAKREALLKAAQAEFEKQIPG